MIRPKNLSTLYQFITASFCVIVVLSNIISAKMVKLPFFVDFSIPAGLITYPLTFLLCDLTTEIYGAAKAKMMVYVTLGMNILAFGILQIALALPAQSLEEQRLIHAVLGLSGLRIFSSLTAYGIAQLVDIQVYSLIKRWTGLRFLWIRANGSTWAAQLVDTILIDIIFLYWGMGMSMVQVAPIMLFSFIYKAFFSVATTPFFYICVFFIRGKVRLAHAPGTISSFSNQ